MSYFHWERKDFSVYFVYSFSGCSWSHPLSQAVYSHHWVCLYKMASVEKDRWREKAGGHLLTISWCLLTTAFLKPSFKPPHPDHQRCLWKSMLLVDEKDESLCQMEMRCVLEGMRQEAVRSLWKHLNDLKLVALVRTCVWFEKGASAPSSFGTCDS